MEYSPSLMSDRIQRQKFYASSRWRSLRDKLKFGLECDSCCEYCRIPFSWIAEEDIHLDHILPLKFNWHLRLEENNLQFLCASCNQLKCNDVFLTITEKDRKKFREASQLFFDRIIPIQIEKAENLLDTVSNEISKKDTNTQLLIISERVISKEQQEYLKGYLDNSEVKQVYSLFGHTKEYIGERLLKQIPLKVKPSTIPACNVLIFMNGKKYPSRYNKFSEKLMYGSKHPIQIVIQHNGTFHHR